MQGRTQCTRNILYDAAIMSFDPNTDELYRGIFSDAPVRELAAGETLIHAGDEAKQVFTVLSGCLMVSRVGRDGRRQVLSFGFKDHFVGLTTTNSYFFTVEAVTPVKVAWRSREHMETYLTQAPEAEKNFREMLFRVLESSLDQVYSLGQRTAVERLAVFILYLRRQYKIANSMESGPDSVELPMSRQDIADFLGLKKETVSRSFTALDDKGLISRPDSHSVEILNIEALRELAGITDFASPFRLVSPV